MAGDTSANSSDICCYSGNFCIDFTNQEMETVCVTGDYDADYSVIIVSE